MIDSKKIVGHKTLSDGSHVPLYEDEADALMAAADAAKEDRAKRMPDEQAAIRAMWDGWYRLKELGWSEAMYCPKDGSAFQVIEAGSTGVFECRYRGEWPTGSFDVYADDDVWPSHPVLFKRYPKEQAEYAAKMAEAAARYADSTHDWFTPDFIGYECCRNCGVVRRTGRKNKICRGKVSVGLRSDT